MNIKNTVKQKETQVKIITAVLLIIGFTDQNIGYYSFLRWAVFVASIYSVIISYKSTETIDIRIWIFGIIGLIFNPITPFYLGRDTWMVTDLIAAIIFISADFIVINRMNND
ncbi:MAG: hypothetical protein GXX85_00515 [Ignavibacteria bacterium]|nr:hypothetical protein [Ignavibacteria bacterium]